MNVQRTQLNEFSGTIENLGFFGNIYARHMTFPKTGDSLSGHSHEYDHVTLLSAGALQVKLWGVGGAEKITDYTAPAFIEIQANRSHELTALSDRTEAWCIFAVRDLDGTVMQRVDDDSLVTGF